MPDYKKMYLTMVDATEKAIELLIAAQQTCEELYISAASARQEDTDGKETKSGS